mmetsp:Transcript_144496/g.204410  ORF Transcript_144496/g.204410 Transcript_144496/m.204410 type:complete len:158 (+) Transcript_144496:45-518(+)
MLIPKKDRITIYTKLFEDGTMCAKKDFNAPKHHMLDVPNIWVMHAMKSLVSRGYLKEQFSWQWYYWMLTNEGIEYLRSYLHFPDELVPNTLKKPQGRRDGGDRDFRGGRGGDRRGGDRGARRGGFGDKKAGAPSAGDIGFGGRGGGAGRGKGFGAFK